MADLTMGCSSPFVENPEREKVRGNLSTERKTLKKKQYLYEEFFPDITLLELTYDQTMNDLSILNSTQALPLAARTTLTPRIEVNKTNFSQPRNLDKHASISWLDDECLPEMTASLLDSSENITTTNNQLSNTSLMATTESNLKHVANLTLDETDKMSTCSTSTASQMTRPQNEEQDLPTWNDEGPALEDKPQEQDSLPFENTAEVKTNVTNAHNITISQLDKTSLTDAHHSTFDTKLYPQSTETTLENTFSVSLHRSNSSLSMSQQSSNDNHHNTFDAKAPCRCMKTCCCDAHYNTFEAKSSSSSSGAVTISENSSSNHHHNIFNANPPSDTILSKSDCYESHDKSSDAVPPCKLNGTIPLSKNISCDSHHNTSLPSGTLKSGSSSSNPNNNTFDANTPSSSASSISENHSNNSHHCKGDCDQKAVGTKSAESNGSLNISESHLSDNHHNTFDANPPQSSEDINKLESQSNKCPQIDMCAELLKSNDTKIKSESSFSDGHQHSSETIHSKPNGTIVMSESQSSEPNHNSFDVEPPKPDGSMTMAASQSDFHKDNLDVKVCKSNGTIPMSETISVDSHSNDFSINTKTVEPLQGTLEADRNEASASEAVQCEPKDALQSLTCDQSTHTDDKSNAFNLDETIDMKSMKDPVITSTPLGSGKMDNFAARLDENKLLAAHEKCDEVDANKAEPEVQALLAIPSNISTQKILSEPATKPSLPRLKASLLRPRFKQTALVPGRGEVAATAIPMMRRNLQIRTPTEGSTVSTSYNLRPLNTATRLPKCGMERPQLRGRPPFLGGGTTLGSNAPAFSTSNETSSNTAVNTHQRRMRDPSRDAQSVVKRPKMDVPTSSRPAVLDANGAVTKSKSLKFPVQRQGTQLAKGPAKQAIPAERQDEDEAFLMSLLPRIKKIKQDKKHLLRSRLLKALSDTEK
ncbi:probable serine/threonine-protein kinase DDB_G0282963 [Corythoichthys intestinalis]|uniref:probable serine/threonine-protein kinase DDB_G0282963 n=1 Tax=Corythoichthys intestinalis TaxID=161448 RepID=UPI0025A5B9E4|nr:probable serine/threonine-protein kinase DDB_G0282963 [Corythoichthys intestinalis]